MQAMRKERIMRSLRRLSGRAHGHVRGVIPCYSGSMLGLLTLTTITGCKELTGSQQLPSGTQNPAFYATPAGALGMRTAALYHLEQEIPNFIVDAGLLTDELESNQTGSSISQTQGAGGGSLDERMLPEPSFG